MLRQLRNPKHLRKIKSNNKTKTKRNKQKIVTFKTYTKAGKEIFKGNVIHITFKTQDSIASMKKEYEDHILKKEYKI